MDNKKAARPVVIVRRGRKGGHGSHGGSWKVAYADFVTAMMAFFMVLWIVGMDAQTRKAIEGYFSNPVGYKKGYSSGATFAGTGTIPTTRNNQAKMIIRSAEDRAFKNTAERIQARLDSLHGAFGSAKYEVTVGDRGLRIELVEAEGGENIFPRGSAEMKPAAQHGLSLIAAELAQLRNPIIVEGHTDAATYGESASSTNWDLSTDRANAARRVLQAGGLPPQRISEIRGFADTELRRPDDPLAAENRRISILLPFSDFRSTVSPNEPGR